MQLIPKKINDHPYNDNQYSNPNDVFAPLCIHTLNIFGFWRSQISILSIMKILFLFAGLFGFFMIYAQKSKSDSWTITHNSKLKLKATEEAPDKNSISISAAELKKKGSLVVAYSEAQKQKDWKRSITVFDAQDNDLMTVSGSTMTISNDRLKKMIASDVHTLKIYTWSLPTDPELAARIRVARKHIGTIYLK